jgi:hypothetical protein
VICGVDCGRATRILWLIYSWGGLCFLLGLDKVGKGGVGFGVVCCEHI